MLMLQLKTPTRRIETVYELTNKAEAQNSITNQTPKHLEPQMKYQSNTVKARIIICLYLFIIIIKSRLT